MKHTAGFDFVPVTYIILIFVQSVDHIGGQLVSVDDLVRRSDFIVLTQVLVPETVFVINKDRLALMKSNAVIINVGRGRKYNNIMLRKIINVNSISPNKFHVYYYEFTAILILYYVKQLKNIDDKE